jgi:hypothetical protein
MDILTALTSTIGIFDGNLCLANPSKPLNGLWLSQSRSTSAGLFPLVYGFELLIKEMEEFVTPGKIRVAPIRDLLSPPVDTSRSGNVDGCECFSTNPNSSSLFPKRAMSFKRKYGLGTVA